MQDSDLFTSFCKKILMHHYTCNSDYLQRTVKKLSEYVSITNQVW